MARILDEIDRQIVAILQSNGRTANVDIARQLGIAEATVRKRLDRLLGQQVIGRNGRPAGRLEEFRTEMQGSNCVIREYVLGRAKFVFFPVGRIGVLR